jgi:uncharacterized pyridoxal phosphate-containing UPF0001 family protein
MRIIVGFLLLISMQLNAQNNTLNFFRENYIKAVSDKKLCLQMIKELEELKGEPIFLAYLGGLQSVKANHVFNPIKKLSTFNRGKSNIEKAVKLSPTNPEIRFIRLSIQKNIPGFLGYKNNIQEDIKLINSNQFAISSNVVLQHIEELIKK